MRRRWELALLLALTASFAVGLREDPPAPLPVVPRPARVELSEREKTSKKTWPRVVQPYQPPRVKGRLTIQGVSPDTTVEAVVKKYGLPVECLREDAYGRWVGTRLGSTGYRSLAGFQKGPDVELYNGRVIAVDGVALEESGRTILSKGDSREKVRSLLGTPGMSWNRKHAGETVDRCFPGSGFDVQVVYRQERVDWIFLGALALKAAWECFPLALEEAAKARFPGWKLSPRGMEDGFLDSRQRYGLAWIHGDFDGDRRLDHVLHLVQPASGSQAVALFRGRPDGFQVDRVAEAPAGTCLMLFEGRHDHAVTISLFERIRHILPDLPHDAFILIWNQNTWACWFDGRLRQKAIPRPSEYQLRGWNPLRRGRTPGPCPEHDHLLHRLEESPQVEQWIPARRPERPGSGAPRDW